MEGAMAAIEDSEQRNQSGAESQVNLRWKRAEEERQYSGLKAYMPLLESRLHTVLRSLSVLDTWLEQNASNKDDEARVRRMKRWRREALKELTFIRQQIELVSREPEALEAKGFTENS
jgi:hypothetical protein